jgi:hypothetical protein
MSRNFLVASLEGNRRRQFDKLDSALLFAAKQARMSWRTPSWTVKANSDDSIRILVDVSNGVEILRDGQVVGTGCISGTGKALFTGPAWDVVEALVS